MRATCLGLLFASGTILCGQTSSAIPASIQAEIDRIRGEITRVEPLVQQGVLPRVRLEQTEDLLADAQDDAILRSTLYEDSISVKEIYSSAASQDLSEQHADQMVAAAQRRLDRERKKLGKARQLVEQGVLARNTLTEIEAEIISRAKTIELAITRAGLLREIAQTARAERAAMVAENSPFLDRSAMVRYSGSGAMLALRDLRVLELAFMRKFFRRLPISAAGQTSLHLALGFDHRGRVDVAVNPDHSEGVWIRKYLEKQRIPYYAFRTAIAGKATAPHIHIGPGSTHLSSGFMPALSSRQTLVRAVPVRLARARRVRGRSANVRMAD